MVPTIENAQGDQSVDKPAIRASMIPTKTALLKAGSAGKIEAATVPPADTRTRKNNLLRQPGKTTCCSSMVISSDK
jgi:hypothetical protein